MRGFLGPALIVVGESLELSRDRSVRHGFGGTKQSLCCSQIFLAAS
jgi:hypothetical protein